MVSQTLSKPASHGAASVKRTDDDSAADLARAQALRDEVTLHNEHARHLFSVFAVWWAFSLTINLAGLVAVAAFGYVHSFPAMVGAFLNFCGSAFCMMVGVRLVLIHDRVSKVLHAQFGSPDDAAEGPNLANPPKPVELVRAVFNNIQPPRLGSGRTPCSAVPVGFYLSCIIPAMLINSPSFGAMWLAARFTMPASKIEMLEQQRAQATPDVLNHDGSAPRRYEVVPSVELQATGANP